MQPMVMHHICQQIKAGKKITPTPLWIMRQAGRYLPEYRAIRQKVSFLELCRNPELSAEVTMQPLERFNLDFGIIFSDILLPLCDYGIEVAFPDGGGIRVQADLEAEFHYLDQGNIRATCEAIQIMKTKLPSKPLFGFAGGPWTLASYILEGGTSSTREFRAIKRMQYENPTMLKDLLNNLAFSMADYLNKQIIAGADLVQIFESWAGELSAEEFHEWVMPYLRIIMQSLPVEVPKSLYVKNSTLYAESLADIGLDILSIDYRTQPAKLWKELSNNSANTIKCIQGNLDPILMTIENLEVLSFKVHELLNTMQALPCSHIVNLGHGITPDGRIENVERLIQAVKDRAV